MKTKKIHKVSIIDATNNVVSTQYVRHFDARQAKSWATENLIESGVASQNDIIAMVKSGARIVGLPEDESDSLPLPLKDPVDEAVAGFTAP